MRCCGFEHTHLHTSFSLLDGYGDPEEYSLKAKQNNQKFLCISDHGTMGAIPRQIKTCDENKLFPIFACELYVNPLQPKIGDGLTSSDFAKELNEEDKKKFRKSNHLLAIAYSKEGYSNLVKLSSWGWINGFYYKPRVNHEILMQHKEGIIFTSCCYNSEIGWAFETSGEDAAMSMVEKYLAMFGDKFYLELMLLDFKKQKPYDQFLLKAHDKYHIPLTISQDVHYCQPEDSAMQRLMLMVQTGKTISAIQEAIAKDEMAETFELQDQNLWMKSEEELNDKWEKDYKDVIDKDLFESAKLNTVKICEFAKGVELDRSVKLPQIPNAKEILKDEIVAGFKKRHLPKTSQYFERAKEEYDLICKKEFASYFLIQKMITDEARRVCPSILGFGDGSEAVGCGRGSAAGALICYCLGITDIDPIKHDLLFSRFLNPARGGKSMKLRFTNIDPMVKEQI